MSQTQEVTEYKCDRNGWPTGEWDSEPDRLDFEYAGFSCLLLRGPVGSWCGYVGVPESHSAFGKDYNSVDVEVHGGLTYANTCNGHICHVPGPGMPEKVWWLGFDTAHLYDLGPAMIKYQTSKFHTDDVYRTMNYTRQQTERLAEQLASQ
jgi:hypothetical protein